MESSILAKKNIYFHGIWKAGYRVSDKLVKSIANEIGSKPSRLCTLHLTTAGLTLEVPPTNDGKTRKTDHVAFSSLRDISVNMYQRSCLLIIYVDSSNTFSIMTCSHQDERELEDIANAFRRQKNALLKSVHPETQSPAAANWTLRQNQASPERNTGFERENYLRSSVSNGVGHTVVNNEALSKERHAVHNRNSTHFNTQSIAMNDYNNDDDVFSVSGPVVVHEPEHLTRIPVEGGHHGHSSAFNVEVQTAAYEEDFDVESITSAVSQMSSIKSDAQGAFDDASLSPTLKYSEISSDQYFNLEHSQGNRLLAEIHPIPRTTTEARHNRRSSTGDDEDWAHEEHAQDGDTHHVVMNGINPGAQTYHLRSQGTQTINSGKIGRRYAKKQMSRTSSNSYKEKVDALRKRSSSTGPKSPNSAASSSAGRVPQPATRTSVGPGARQSRSSVADSNVSQSSHPVKRNLSIGSTTVIKSIEDVYAGRSTRRVNSARSRRPINLIIYSPSPPSPAT
ncbi:hypothetical protein BsWGS_07533 [Bradybaena similaris]